MHAVMEYLSAGIIIALILGSTSQYTLNMVSDRMNLIERNLGLDNADKIIDLLLLSTGRPEGWGVLEEDPEELGLASENAIKPYQLDSDKVRRLSSGSQYHINPGRVRDLLGLSPYYYISIKIIPIFNITINQISDERFTITLTEQWNKPVYNINITAAYLMDDDPENAYFSSNTTNMLGSCTLNFSGAGTQDTLLIHAGSMGISSFKSWPSPSNYLLETETIIDRGETVVGVIESSMGSVSGYNSQTVSRKAEIEGLDYIITFTIWS